MVLTGMLIHQVKEMAGGPNESLKPSTPVVENEKREYHLSKTATGYQKEIFDELLEAQKDYQNSQTEQTTQAYATAIVKNFIADFYTWTNKVNHSDVGGVQFIDKEMRSAFKKQAIDGYYETLDYYLENEDASSLMSVNKVQITNVNLNDVIEVEGDEDEMEQLDCISLQANWSYEPMGLAEETSLQTTATFILTKVDGDLFINAILSE